MDRPTRLARLHTLAALLALAALLGLPAAAAAQGVTYRITVTNLTPSQILSPPVVVAHGIGLSLFTPGSPASHELAVLAEDGDTAPLEAMLAMHPDVASFAVGEGIPPGASTTVEVQSHGRLVFLSMVSMLVTTNDGFAGLRLHDLRGGHWLREVLVEAWDAGSEANNEDCDFIPGPPCGNPMVRDTAGAEGFVGIHPGIRGIGDLAPEVWDWKNPVALVRIARTAGPAGS
jgi:hypothetical protein